MTAEEIIASALERRIGSVPLQTRLKITLEQPVLDYTGRPLSNVAGWVERHTPGGVQIRLLSTEAGRTARALLEDQLLDVALSRDYPPTVRLK